MSVAHTEFSWQTMETVTPVVNADTLNGKLKIRKLNIFLWDPFLLINNQIEGGFANESEVRKAKGKDDQ